MIFITLEGPEGSGKTSILFKVKEKFLADNIEIFCTREPGGTIISEQIRNIILSKENISMDFWTEVLLYNAARRQHLAEKILPEINSKKIYICDRFIDSTLAYQGYGRNLDIKKIKAIQDIILDDFKPNLTIFFNIKPKQALKRVNNRSASENNRLDEETLKFHELVYKGYQKIIEENQDRIKIVDASKTFDEVVEQVYQVIKSFINK